MSPTRPHAARRFGAIVAALGLALTLAACDSGGSSGAEGTSSTTRRHRPSTTSSTTRPDAGSTTSSTTGATGTTAPTSPPTSTPPAGGTCGGQAAAITAAVTSGDLGPVPVESYTVADCRLAASQPIWGAVTLVPKPGETVDQLTVVLERLGSIWTVHSYNTGATGCDIPAPVPAELRLGC